MINMTINGENRYHLPPDMIHWEKYNITSVVFLQKSAI